MLLYTLLAVAAVIVILLFVISRQPDTFRVTRSATMDAPPPDVFAQVNNLHNWEAWSPWQKLDPDMEQAYEGPAAGPGAKQSWNGNSKVGEGSMTITESRPNEQVDIKLDFIRPFTCSNEVQFTFEPKGNQTLVTWSMTGHNKFINKAVCLVMNMDKMCGGQFEQGLASMKAIVEGNSAPDPAPSSTDSLGDNLAQT